MKGKNEKKGRIFTVIRGKVSIGKKRNIILLENIQPRVLQYPLRAGESWYLTHIHTIVGV